MVEMIFQFEVAKETQEAFFKFVKEGTKPWWESHGCLSYTVWQVAGENRFMKRMRFSDMATFEKVIPVNEQDPEGKALIEKFDTFVTNVSQALYMKVD